MLHIMEYLEYSMIRNTIEYQKPEKKKYQRQRCVKRLTLSTVNTHFFKVFVLFKTTW